MRDLPASTSRMLRLKTCATTRSWTLGFWCGLSSLNDTMNHVWTNRDLKAEFVMHHYCQGLSANVSAFFFRNVLRVGPRLSSLFLVLCEALMLSAIWDTMNEWMPRGIFCFLIFHSISLLVFKIGNLSAIFRNRAVLHEHYIQSNVQVKNSSSVDPKSDTLSCVSHQ